MLQSASPNMIQNSSFYSFIFQTKKDSDKHSYQEQSCSTNEACRHTKTQEAKVSSSLHKHRFTIVSYRGFTSKTVSPFDDSPTLGAFTHMLGGPIEGLCLQVLTLIST